MTRRVCVLLIGMGVVSLMVPALLESHRMLLWNASASVPVGNYLIETTDTRYVSELVAVLPPEPLARYLEAGNYLPCSVPMLKHVLALPGQRWSRRNHR